MARLASLTLAALFASHALVTTNATAQTVAGNFAELRPLLKQGLKVVVIDHKGRKTTGRVTEVRSDGFALDTGGDSPTPFGDGNLEARWRTDSLRNGLFAGLAAGAVSGGVMLASICGPEDDCTDYGGKPGLFLMGALIGGGIGAGIGTALDHAIARKELVVEYRWLPGQTQTLRIAPRVDRRRVGLAATLNF